jgi:hypothetical protein
MEPNEVKKARAELNKALQACKTRSDFHVAYALFQSKHGIGIWAMPTFHNSTETFRSLSEAHQDRVIRDDLDFSAEGQIEWRETVGRASAIHFPAFENQYNSHAELQTQENADALSLRRRELGLEEFAEDEPLYGDDRMNDPVMIIGDSGSGKSRSLKDMDPASTFIIQTIRKSLPFKGWREKWSEATAENPKGNYAVQDDPAAILNFMTAISARRPEIKNIVIDDAQYIMGNEFMRSAMETGYTKFTRIGLSFWTLAMEARKLRGDLRVTFLMHSETTDAGQIKAKTIGKMLDDKITLEGMFTIVLRAAVRDGKHVFLTKNSGNDTVKAPEDMFPAPEIENNLSQVLEAINAY